MKTLMTILILLALGLAGCADLPVPFSQSYKAQIQPSPEQNKALVYFYNIPDEHFSLFSKTNPNEHYAILEGGENGKELGVIGCGPKIWRLVYCHVGTYTWMYVTPNQHTFTIMFIEHRGTGEPKTITLLPNHTYYFQIIQESAAYSQNLWLREIPSAEAIQSIQASKYCQRLACDIKSIDTYDAMYQQKLAKEKK